MSAKSLLKNIVGEHIYMRIRNFKRFLFYLNYRLRGIYNKLDIQNEDYEVIDVISLNNKHVFFGYYDIQQINSNNNKLLMHVVSKRAIAGVDAVEICIYDMQTKQIHPIATSKAWSWQQGSRLMWSPININQILFNDFSENKYVCVLWDIEKKEKIKTIPIPLYDIDRKQSFGIGVNFVRLQRLRPGYGYCNIYDKTINENIPKNDGIFRYDFITNEVKLIISYEQLIMLASGTEKYQHYINHISISPNGDKFMFFHLWQLGNVNSWKLQMCVANTDGADIHILEETDIISHYTWHDNNHILTTKINKNGDCSCYTEYNIVTGEKKSIGDSSIYMDGHPSFTPDKNVFLTDTYPQANQLQYLYLYDIKEKLKTPIMSVFHDTRLYGEKRCDLHPRITPDGRFITLDCVKSNGRKQILILKRK